MFTLYYVTAYLTMCYSIVGWTNPCWWPDWPFFLHSPYLRLIQTGLQLTKVALFWLCKLRLCALPLLKSQSRTPLLGLMFMNMNQSVIIWTGFEVEKVHSDGIFDSQKWGTLDNWRPLWPKMTGKQEDVNSCTLSTCTARRSILAASTREPRKSRVVFSVCPRGRYTRNPSTDIYLLAVHLML